MSLIFWTDPHLGLNRTSHTTPQSRKALRDALYKQALKVSNTEGTSFCLGDLFDQASNSEDTLKQGLTVLKNTDFTLHGNHDEPGRVSVLSSIALCAEVLDDQH